MIRSCLSGPLSFRPTALILVCLTMCGCAAHFAPVNATMKGAQGQFDIPPKEMIEDVKKIVSSPPLSIGVQEVDKGSVVTGYQSFPGDWHIGRRWQERTQYRITIIPDWDQPTAKCMVEVRELTEQRAAEGMKWAPATDVVRPERAEAILKAIQAEAGKMAASQPAGK